MPSVRRNSNTLPIPNPDPNPNTPATHTSEIEPAPALTCKQPPRPPSGDPLLPLGASRLERLPPAILAYGVGDSLEFDERSDFGAASKAIHAAMDLGTTHPLYAKLYEEQLSGTQDGVKRARANVNADRARREEEEATRAAYVLVRKDWALKVQNAFAANPRDVMHIHSMAKLLGELGRSTLAVQVLQWGLDQFPKDRTARLQLAGLLLQVRPPADSPEPNAHTDEAITQARLLKDLTPNDSRPRAIIARALLLQARELTAKGKEAAALAARQAALAELRTLPEGIETLTLAMVEHSLGHAVESAAALETHLRKSRGLPADVKLAEVYAWRGETKLALDCLEQAFEDSIHNPGLCHIAHSPFVDSIRGDERWLKLQRRMNRAPDQLEAIPCTVNLP